MEAEEREKAIIIVEDDSGEDSLDPISFGTGNRDDEYADEILAVATKLGLDVKKAADRRFVWIAEQALINPLSSCVGWTEEEDDNGFVFYYHAESGETTWDPPSLSHFSNVLETLRVGVSSAASVNSPNKSNLIDAGVTWSPERFEALPASLR